MEPQSTERREPTKPLMLAARANHVEALKVLIKNGANPLVACRLKWAFNWTAHDLALFEKHRKAAAYLATVTPGRQQKAASAAHYVKALISQRRPSKVFCHLIESSPDDFGKSHST